MVSYYDGHINKKSGIIAYFCYWIKLKLLINEERHKEEKTISVMYEKYAQQHFVIKASCVLFHFLENINCKIKPNKSGEFTQKWNSVKELNVYWYYKILLWLFLRNIQSYPLKSVKKCLFKRKNSFCLRD